MKTLFFILSLILINISTIAQSDVQIVWQKCYGGSSEDQATNTLQTTDGGFLISGYTSSKDGNVTENPFGYDFWIVKTDSLGAINWQKCYGGSGVDLATNILQTKDGGYLITGTSNSNDGEVTGFHGGNNDYWIVKTDSAGAIQWQKCYGGSGDDVAKNALQTKDGGYLITGYTSSKDGDVSGNHSSGYSDYWIVKTDSLGGIQWQKCYGGSSSDEASSTLQTSDGGYLISGSTHSNDGDVSGNHGNEYSGADYWIVKTDSIGGIQWQKCYGGSSADEASSTLQTSDGGYLINGISVSNDGDVTDNHGQGDYWIVKTDLSGSIQWQKCYGGSGTDWAYNAFQTLDSGYLITGVSHSNDGEVSGNHGGDVDYWIVKTDSAGAIQWQKCYGGSGADYAKSAFQTKNGGYLITGNTFSKDGDVTGYHESYEEQRYDFWLVQLCTPDLLSVSISDTVYCTSTTLTATAGFASYRWSTGETTLSIKVSSGGTYKVVAINLSGCSTESQIVVSDPIPTHQGDTIVISDPFNCFSTPLVAPAGFASYLWNTGETTQTIIINVGGNYNVVATNLLGCAWKSEISVQLPPLPYNNEQICMVTIDEQTGKNTIIAEKELNAGIDSIMIYRMNNESSQYQNIGSISNGIFFFIDNEAIPAQQNYQYKISVKDACGSESGLSDAHRTILLQANSGINNEVNLFWNPYEGFSYPNFQIYRSNNENPYFLIASVPNNVYTFIDLMPPSGSKKYQVRVSKESSCFLTKSSYNYVSSNVIYLSTVGVDENKLNSISLYPNPSNDNVTVKISVQMLGSKYEILDLTGRKILSGKLDTEVSDINISQLSAGVYTFTVGKLNNQRLKLIKK